MTLSGKCLAALAILACVLGAYFTAQMINRRAHFTAGRDFCRANNGTVFETPDGFGCFYNGKTK